MTMTKIPEMRGVNSKLADIKAATSELSLTEKKALLEELTAQVQAAAVGGPQRRLAAVKAAATAKDARTKGAFETAVKMLKRLGSELDAVCASGNIDALDIVGPYRRVLPVPTMELRTAIGGRHETANTDGQRRILGYCPHLYCLQP